ncbi:MAG TPA: phage minor head protein [Methylococcus sp.]|nr:phage minor head protein [Methylococcus sp.]
MRDQEIFAALFGRPPAEAVAFLERKGLAITWNWAEMLDEAHARSLTVAKMTRIDLLQDVRRGLLSALREGKTGREFARELTPILQAKGWWGKQIHVSADGQAQVVRLGSPSRLKTIYQTNLQSAYMAGRAQTQMQADAFPYLQYVAVLDGRTRPSHRALHGRVFAKDDPIWQIIMPPNGFNCRCRTRALTARQVEREGLAPMSSAGRLRTIEVDAQTDPRTGEIFRARRTGIEVPGPDGRPVFFAPDAGFNASPLASHVFDDLLMQKAIAALGEEAAFEVVRREVLSGPRRKAWQAFIANTYDFGRRQGQTMTAGIVPWAVVQALARAGRRVAPVLFVEDGRIVGKKARRHMGDGDAPSRQDWEGLPLRLSKSNGEFYLDVTSGNLAWVIREEGRALMLSIDPRGHIDTAYWRRIDDIDAAVRGGRLKEVRQ